MGFNQHTCFDDALEVEVTVLLPVPTRPKRVYTLEAGWGATKSGIVGTVDGESLFWPWRNVVRVKGTPGVPPEPPGEGE